MALVDLVKGEQLKGAGGGVVVADEDGGRRGVDLRRREEAPVAGHGVADAHIDGVAVFGGGMHVQ
jgi:hypothetical protein